MPRAFTRRLRPRRRLTGRGTDSPEVIAARMERARAEISHWDGYDYVVVNDDIDACFAKVEQILRVTRAEPRYVGAIGEAMDEGADQMATLVYPAADGHVAVAAEFDDAPVAVAAIWCAGNLRREDEAGTWIEVDTLRRLDPLYLAVRLERLPQHPLPL